MDDNNLNTLSEEEIFLLDLLADGELDEETRRELLLRLDQTSDGWRRCACAFLENQCFREAFRHSTAAEPAALAEPAEPADPRVLRDSLWKTVNSFDRFSPPPARSSSLHDESASLPESASLETLKAKGPQRKPAPEVTASPINAAVAAPAKSRSFWKPAFISAVCLLVASLALVEYRHQAARRDLAQTHYTGVLQDAYAPADTAAEPAELEVADAGEVPAESDEPASETAQLAVAASSSVSSGADTLAPAGSIASPSMPLVPNAPHGIRARTGMGIPVAAKSAGLSASGAQPAEKVRHITIRRPGGLDEISVPCVEAESYVSDNSAAEALANNYREAGCQVETLHEELKFQLKNGKTVIVPVDTIDVQHAPRQTTHFL